jgi:hypothetical protein
MVSSGPDNLNYLDATYMVRKHRLLNCKDIWKVCVCVCDPVMDLCMSFRNILHKWGIERRGNLCLRTIYVASKYPNLSYTTSGLNICHKV